MANKGLTLLELVIALGLITIVSGGVLMASRGTDRRHLENASLQLQADLRYAQRRAITEGRRYGVVFEPAQNRYHVILDRPVQTIRTVNLPGGVSILETTAPRIVFLPRGTVTEGFTIILQNGRYTQRLTGTVSGGRVRIFDITYH